MAEVQILYIILMLLCGCARIGVKAAYQNGVTDGYGYRREPNNPGYAKAGKYLKQTMAHRWPELRKDHDSTT